MRAVTLLLLFCAASTDAVAGTWSWADLWSTPEQRGQQLLESKRAAEAVPLFRDPRRRGYAESRAGEFADAAKSLAPLHDADSLYNRGNALAHTGQLHDALGAYDAALAQAPGNRDITRNRELVERALREQQQKGGSGNPPGAGSHGKGDTGQTGQQGKQTQGGGAGQSADQNPGGGRSADQNQGRGAGQSADQNQGGGAGQSADPKTSGSQSPGPSQSGNPGQSEAQAQSQAANQSRLEPPGQGPQAATQTSPGQAGSQTPSASSAQAENSDARGKQALASSYGNSRSGQNADVADESKRAIAAQASGARVSEAAQSPPQQRSEQALALDQWLRGIPDDSGELLRRKFLIEHMMKEQGNEP
jgi:Ca-activated chloride channel family protein